MKEEVVYTDGWDAYELLDSGDGMKLERFGSIVLERPDPQALWKKQNPALWEMAHASFSWKEKGARWNVKKEFPEAWNIAWESARFSLSLKEFKHVGLFPEHRSQWKKIAQVCNDIPCRVLNLFGYTGAASVVAALAGAEVTHVDASKHALSTLKENIQLSGLPENSIRLVCEEALRYAKRLKERGETFDIIIMDPPAFGRGPKGEVWKIEEHLAELLSLIPHLLSKDPKMVILNGYASGYSARTFGELLHDILGDRGEITYGEIGITQKNSDRVLTTGIYAGWKN